MLTISVASGVSSRTRRENVPLFGCLSLDDSSSKRRKSDGDEMVCGSVSGSRKEWGFREKPMKMWLMPIEDWRRDLSHT